MIRHIDNYFCFENVKKKVKYFKMCVYKSKLKIETKNGKTEEVSNTFYVFHFYYFHTD